MVGSASGRFRVLDSGDIPIEAASVVIISYLLACVDGVGENVTPIALTQDPTVRRYSVGKAVSDHAPADRSSSLVAVTDESAQFKRFARRLRNSEPWTGLVSKSATICSVGR